MGGNRVCAPTVQPVTAHVFWAETGRLGGGSHPGRAGKTRPRRRG
jgi:hypothetical protein